MPAHDVCTNRRKMDRIERAQLRVVRVWIPDEVGSKRVEDVARRVHRRLIASRVCGTWRCFSKAFGRSDCTSFHWSILATAVALMQPKIAQGFNALFVGKVNP